jgi:uncharacterized RDD family membrane protein YckC
MAKASVGKRVVAYIIDCVLISVIIGVIMGGSMLLTFVVAMISSTLAAMSMILWFGAMGLSFLAMFGYLLVRDALGSGRSIGKKFMGLKVVKGGQKCSYMDSAKRNVTLIIPLLNIVELVMPFVDKDGLRFGDKFAGTEVVEA